MKSILFTLLSLMISTSSFARDPGDPVIPWPSTIGLQQVLPEDLLGTWVSFGENSLWYVEITGLDANLQKMHVKVQSHALFSHEAEGSIYIGKSYLWGWVVNSEHRFVGLVVFKDKDGLKVRLSRTGKIAQEMILYPTNNTRPLK